MNKEEKSKKRKKNQNGSSWLITSIIVHPISILNKDIPRNWKIKKKLGT